MRFKSHIVHTERRSCKNTHTLERVLAMAAIPVSIINHPRKWITFGVTTGWIFTCFRVCVRVCADGCVLCASFMVLLQTM